LIERKLVTLNSSNIIDKNIKQSLYFDSFCQKVKFIYILLGADTLNNPKPFANIWAIISTVLFILFLKVV